MGDPFNSSIVFAVEKNAVQISNLYLAVIIIIICAFCFTPIELFILEIWPLHGSLSLIFFVAPLIAGYLIARALPDRYFRVKHFESSGRIYEYLGIRFFKRLVPNGVYINQLIRRYNPNYRVVRDRDSMIQFEVINTRWAERSHIASLVLMLPSAVYALTLGWINFAFLILLPNILLHVYPVLLQRYTRARIQRALMKHARSAGY